jgi:hypothetical protein
VLGGKLVAKFVRRMGVFDRILMELSGEVDVEKMGGFTKHEVV